MSWMRFTHEGRPMPGRLQGGQVLLHSGALFDTPQPTGTSLALADVPADDWLPPCAPGKIIGL